MLALSYCKFWIYWVGVNTKLSCCKFCIYTHPVNSKFTIWQRRNLKIWRFLNISRMQKSFLILIFYIKFFGNPTILNHSVISFDFNFQSNRKFLRYKALKNYVLTGSTLLQKFKILPKRRKKTKSSDLESTWEGLIEKD